MVKLRVMAKWGRSHFLKRTQRVVAGGESGPNARPMDPDWARSLRDQCEAAGVPFFFKQWGGASAKSGGRLLDGKTWNEMPALSPGTGRRDGECRARLRGGSLGSR